MSIWISGMGLTGSLVARCLYQLNIPFTWTDTNAEHTAWKASTGCIYPSGDNIEQQAYIDWSLWMSEANSPITERAVYHFTQLSPPHGAWIPHWRITEEIATTNIHTLHMNVQAYVEETRKRFAAFRVEADDYSDKKIITHALYLRYSWGWSMKARAEFDDSFFYPMQRVCLYQRVHRYQVNYIYPCPNTPYYYLGTSMIQQLKPQERDPELVIQKFFDTLPSGVTIHDKQPVIQGWRPKGNTVSFAKDNVFFIAPQSGNGVRLAPVYLKEILNWLGHTDATPNPLI